MHEFLSEDVRGHAYLFSIMLAALVVRVLVGLVRPVMSWEQSLLIGLTTVVFLTPALYRMFHGKELLDSRYKKCSHALSMVLSAGLFVYYIALA